MDQGGYRDSYILKGGMLVTQWLDHDNRETRDADFLGFGEADAETIKGIFAEIMAIASDDGLDFDTKTLTATAIREDMEYGGIRLKTSAYLERTRILVTLDIAFGDALVDAAQSIDYPSLLNVERPSIRAYATGFNAYVGPFESINIIGKAGISLKEYWADGVKSYLGMMPSGFPNTFMPLGPLNGGTLCNFLRCIETNVDWVINCILDVEKQGLRKIDARPENEAEWVGAVAAIADQLLFSTVDSWFNGQNTSHRPKQFLAYFGGNPNFHAMLADERQNGYPGFVLS